MRGWRGQWNGPLKSILNTSAPEAVEANEDLSILTGTNVVQTSCIFEISICGDGGASKMVPEEYWISFHRKRYKQKFLGTNEVQTIDIFEILICRGRGSEMVP